MVDRDPSHRLKEERFQEALRQVPQSQTHEVVRQVPQTETQEVVRPAPGFLLFATQNPPGSYGGRKPLSRAFRNRFIEVHVSDLPPRELETILTGVWENGPVDPEGLPSAVTDPALCS